MPLTRGRIVGYDDERLAFGFIMLNGGETVECQISDAAMDELAGVRGSPSTARQALFLRHRDAIEQIASGLFDSSRAVKGAVVRIFTKHIPIDRPSPRSIAPRADGA
jgi:Protein of unknown function (DUF1488)